MEGWNAFSRRNRVFVPNPPNSAGAAEWCIFKWKLPWYRLGMEMPDLSGSAGGVAAEAPRRSLFKM